MLLTAFLPIRLGATRVEALFSGLEEEEALRLRGGHSSKGCFVYALSVALSVSLAPLSLSPPSLSNYWAFLR